MDFKKREEMVRLMENIIEKQREEHNANSNIFTHLSESELLKKLEEVTEEINELELRKSKTKDEAIKALLDDELEVKYEINSMVFEMLFIKYGYNITADDICGLLDIDLSYFFLSTKYYFFNQVKVTTGATRFIKEFIFKEEEYGLKRENPNLEVAQYFQQFHRKKLFFTKGSVEFMLKSACQIVESRMFLDLDLSKYFYRKEAERAIQKYLLEKGYLKAVIKEVTNRKTKEKVRKEVLEPVPQPGDLFPVVHDIMEGNIELLSISNFKEKVVRNHCKATLKVHDQQVKRFLAKSNEVEFVKFGISGRQQKPNMRFYARHTPLEPGHFRIALGWGTDTDELKQELFTLIEEFKEEKEDKK